MSVSGLSSGNFDQAGITYDLSVGLDQDSGIAGEVLISGGTGRPMSWGSNSANLPNALVKGLNIEMTTAGGDVTEFDGLVRTTISATDTNTEYTGTAPIDISASDVISLNKDSTLTTISDNLSVVKVPNTLTITQGASSVVYDGEIAKSITLTDADTTYVADKGVEIDLSTTPHTIKAKVDSDAQPTLRNDYNSDELAVLRVPHNLTPNLGIEYQSGLTSYDGSAQTSVITKVDDTTPADQTISNTGGTGADELNVLRVPNTLTITQGATDFVYDGSVAKSITLSDNTLTLIEGDGIDIQTSGLNSLSKTISADLKAGSGLEFTSGEIDLKSIPNTALAGNFDGSMLASDISISTTGTITTDGITNNGNYTSTNGNITLTNGTFFGNVEGTITEEHINAQSLEIRDGSVSGNTGIDIKDGYNLEVFNTSNNKVVEVSGNVTGSVSLGVFDATSGTTLFSVAPTGAMNNVQNIVFQGTLINNQNSGNIRMNTGTIYDEVSGSSNNLNIDFNAKEIKVRKSNEDRVILKQDGLVINDDAGNESFKVFGGSGVVDIHGQVNVSDNNIILLGDECNIIGHNTKTSGFYDNELKYFTAKGSTTTHSLCGASLEYVVLRSTSARTFALPFVTGGSVITATGLQDITSFNIPSQTAQASACAITIECYLSRFSGSPDCYCRIDTATGTGNSPYASQTSATLVQNTASTLQHRHNFTILITGLSVGTDYAFFPKFCQTITNTKNQHQIIYGASYGDALLSFKWIDNFNTYDPLADDY